MFAIGLEGLDEASALLDALPEALASGLAAKTAELSTALADRVRNDKLTGAVLKARSGALGDSIAADVSADGDGVVASVGSVGDVKYAAIQEYGGRTAAHEILPAKAQALAFVAGGAMRFAREVEHPGSLIPERSYLRSSLEEMSGDIVATLAEAAVEVLERA
jgi:phage gpG-like protein